MEFREGNRYFEENKEVWKALEDSYKTGKVKVIADKYGVSVAQLCLRYDIQLDLVVIPKTANPDHMRNNLELDFTFSDEDMNTLKNGEHIQSYGDHSFFPVFGGKLK
jgi:diketogulonate reductase-like aldo/keto reductase